MQEEHKQRHSFEFHLWKQLCIVFNKFIEKKKTTTYIDITAY